MPAESRVRSVRLAQTLWERVGRASGRGGLSVNEFVRRAVLDAVEASEAEWARLADRAAERERLKQAMRGL